MCPLLLLYHRLIPICQATHDESFAESPTRQAGNGIPEILIRSRIELPER